jgi:pilus assembly protein Flp/PilA
LPWFRHYPEGTIVNKFMVSLLSFWNDITSSDKEKGATATEYALLVGLIALVIIIGVTAFGNNLNSFFSNLASKVGSWT